jgi:hypothetical protein
MPEPSLFTQILNYLTPSFNQAAPAALNPAQAQNVRNLLVEGIKPNAAEIAEEKAQMAKKSLELSCQRDGAFDAVTGRTNVAVCKPFEVRKPF